MHDLRERNITPHVAINAHLTKTGKRPKTAIDGRTLRHAGYDISQRCRKREEVFGWLKTTSSIAQVKVRGLGQGPSRLYLDPGLQSRLNTQAPGDSMKRPTKRTLTGRWRITKMALWDKDFLDMMEPAYIAFDGKLGGEFAFGCVTGGLHCRKTPEGVEFTWEGNNEMDEASGDGWAELQKDGSLEGEIRFHNGDDSTFKARRW